jgi:hypothetical protein
MTTAYTSLLGLALPVTGELSGTWGDTVNNSITSLLDSAVAGTTNVSTDADVTLTTTTGAANTAREAILLFSGARTALRTITAPAQSKVYTVINATTGGYSVKLVGAGPTTGVTIVAGESAVCAWNGSDFVKVSNTGGTASFVDLTVSGNLTLSGGTANGVLYLNGSKIATSGSALTFNASTLAIATAANDQLTWATGGKTGYLYVDSAGVGIGDTALLAGNNTYYNKASNYIASYINGSEQMRLTSTGLGIGTSSPAYKLDVSGSARIGTGTTTPSLLTLYPSASAKGWQISANNYVASALEFTCATANGGTTFSTPSMLLDSSGNLGLGVTPSAWSGYKVLQIATGFSAWSSGTANARINANTYYNGGYKYVGTGTATQYEQDGYHAWYTAPSGTAGNAITFTQAMTLDASGRLGIAQTSPTTILDVGANDSTPKTISLRYSSVPSYYSSTYDGSVGLNTISINTYNTSNGSTSWSAFNNAAYGAAAIQLASQNGSGNFIRFLVGTAANTNPVETARIDSSGNFGIGTSSPAQKLEVSGSSQSSVIYERISNTYGSSTSVGAGTGLQFYGWDAGVSAVISSLREASSYSPSYLSFQTFGGNGNTGGNSLAERMRIDGYGTLGLAVTPSAWSLSGLAAMQIKNGGLYGYDTSEMGVTSNSYFNGGWRYITSVQASRYVQVSGEHRWYNAPSGTAGNAITFTQAMTLEAANNLLIGSTSQNGTNSRLYVKQAGDASFRGVNVVSAAANEWVGSISVLGDGVFNIAQSYLAGTGTYQAISFTTSGTERARIDSSGSLLIGTTTNTASRPLQVYTAGNLANLYLNAARSTAGSEEIARIAFTASAPNTTTSWFIYANDTSAERFSVRSNGGIANYAANNVILSDRREKTNFAFAGSYLDKICAIPVQTFNYIDQNLEEDAGLTLGVVAQDVQAVAPELVMESDWSSEKDGSKTRLSIYQTDLQYALMKCIQEQQAIIESLKARLDAANL